MMPFLPELGAANPTIPTRKQTAGPTPDEQKKEPALVLCLPKLEIGGVTTWAQQMVRLYAQDNRECFILGHHHSQTFESSEQLTKIGFDSLRLRLCPPPGRIRVGKFNGQTYATALPATFVLGWSHGLYATIAKLSLESAHEMRVVAVCHTDSPHYYEIIKFYEPMIHQFVAVSDRTYNRLAELLPNRTSDISLRRYPIRQIFSTQRATRKPGPLRIVYAGRLEEHQKRVTRLVDVARALSHRKVEYRLTVVGSGPAKSLLERRLANSDDWTRSRVLLMAAVPNERIREIFRENDINLMVSEFEGTSISMLEGMVDGCIPVVTDVSGGEMINQGINGFKAPAGDIQKIVSLLADLSRDIPQLEPISVEAAISVRDLVSEPLYYKWFSKIVLDAWHQPPRTWAKHRPLFDLSIRRLQTALKWSPL